MEPTFSGEDRRFAHHLTATTDVCLDAVLGAAGVLVDVRDDLRQQLLNLSVQQAALPEGTTTHDLRHHYASLLLAGSESVVAAAERLGHENATLVLTTYGHLMPGSEDRTRRALDAAWCALGVPSATATSR